MQFDDSVVKLHNNAADKVYIYSYVTLLFFKIWQYCIMAILTTCMSKDYRQQYLPSDISCGQPQELP